MSFALIALLLSAEPARGWKDVDTLVSQQKFDEALKVTQSRLEAAAQGPDELEYARALLRRASLRNGLQQSETAVTELREARLSRALVPRAMVQLAQVEALDAYLREYRWEINEREKIESRTELPLKQMSADQLVAAETRILAELWVQRDALGAETIKNSAEFITPGTWPAGLRDTLRDALAYRWVDLLEDTADWTPDALSQRYTLELPTLIRGVDAKTSLVDGAVHPLLRLCAVLDDLEQWHQKAGRPEAALAARVRRLRVLAANFTRDDERQVVRADLQRVIEATQTLPFSAWARAELADLLRGVGSLEAARDVAKIGATAFPTSIGGQRCKAMVEQLQAPDFNITVTQHDGPGQRSLQVRAKNLNALHFQAYRLTLDEVLKAAGSEAVLPQGDRLKALLKGHEPVRWSLELPATPDLKEHVTSVKPPLTQEGVWVIRASARQSFDDVDNRIVEATMVVSRVSLLHHRG